jgi:hypothetical protein
LEGEELLLPILCQVTFLQQADVTLLLSMMNQREIRMYFFKKQLGILDLSF